MKKYFESLPRKLISKIIGCLCIIFIVFTYRISYSMEIYDRPLNTNRSNGIYILTGKSGDKDFLDVLNTTGIVGVSLTAEWKDLEPQEGHYQWSSLDDAVAKVTHLHKTVTLRTFPGISTPDWVYAKGAKAFEFVDKNPFHGDAFY